MGEPPPFDKDNWELYDGSKDWTQAHDLSKEMPEKLAELQRLWLIEATKYNVLPLDDKTFQRFNPDLAGRPQLIKGNSQLLFAGMGRLSESSVLNVKNKSWTVTAELRDSGCRSERRDGRPSRQVWWLRDRLKQAKQSSTYNFLGLKSLSLEETNPIPTGEHQVRMEFKYDGGGLAKGGAVTLYYDGQKAGEGRVEVTQPMCFSADEGLDIGHESGTNVTPDYSTR